MAYKLTEYHLNLKGFLAMNVPLAYEVRIHVDHKN